VEEGFMQPHTQAVPVSKKMLWAGWIISIVPVLMLSMSAAMKFMMSPDTAKGFADLGWPESYALVLGIVEIGCTVIYVIPRTSVLGAILLTGYFGGAIATHARLGDPMFVVPFILGVLLWLGLFLRDVRLRALLPLRS
jgi:DoxX-like family